MDDENASPPFVVRSSIEPKSNYLDYRDFLRYDFYYSCAYCTMTEVEARGIGFHIDHYFPQKQFPEMINHYENLMWSCQMCNSRKDGFSPNEIQKNQGYYVLRIDRDDPRSHMYLDGFRLKHITNTGEFNIELLDFNRETLIRLRGIRKRLWDSHNYIAYGISEIKKIGVDKIHPTQRSKFIKVRKEILCSYDETIEFVHDFIRNISHSPLLDKDPEKMNHLKKRRKYLDSVQAITQDYGFPMTQKKKMPRKKQKARKKKKDKS